MAGSKSDYLENIFANYLGGTTITPPGTIYVGLWTTTLTDASTGATAGEVSGGSYARVAVTNNSTNFPNASGGLKDNGTEILFPTATADWGTVTHAAFLDAATNGNILYWWDLPTARTILNGDAFRFPAGSIDLTET